MNRGIAYFRLRDLDRSLADFYMVIRLAPRSANGYYNRSLVHEKKSNQAQAEADLQKAKELNPNVTRR